MTALPDALSDLGAWLSLGPREQDALVSEVGAALGPRFAHRRTARYGGGASFRVPTFEHRPSGVVFNLIVGGRFRMGLSASEERAALGVGPDLAPYADWMRPARDFSVRPFLMSRFPVLDSLAREHVTLDPELFRPEFAEQEGDRVPVYLARGEVEALTAKLGFGLPSEAQWEYACRGGTSSLFHFGDALPDEETLETRILLYNFNDEGANDAAANPFGLVGLHVGEWCEDSFAEDYGGHPGSDEPVRGGPPYVVRGGAAALWPWQSGDEWVLCASAMRRGSDTLEDGTCGARLVTSL
jgi:formylglycine-generating enzyme required for sulfatase activity